MQNRARWGPGTTAVGTQSRQKQGTLKNSLKKQTNRIRIFSEFYCSQTVASSNSQLSDSDEQHRSQVQPCIYVGKGIQAQENFNLNMPFCCAKQISNL